MYGRESDSDDSQVIKKDDIQLHCYFCAVIRIMKRCKQNEPKTITSLRKLPLKMPTCIFRRALTTLATSLPNNNSNNSNSQAGPASLGADLVQ